MNELVNQTDKGIAMSEKQSPKHGKVSSAYPTVHCLGFFDRCPGFEKTDHDTGGKTTPDECKYNFAGTCLNKELRVAALLAALEEFGVDVSSIQLPMEDEHGKN